MSGRIPGPPYLRRGMVTLAIALAALSAAALQWTPPGIGSRGPTAENNAAETSSARADGKPYGLPFAEPSGLGTWYVSQPYGNTIYAFHERERIYRSGQGLHMGLDFAAACQTVVVAIADGTVRSVDGPGGSPPHNLMIDHGDGYVSFYGHLYERPRLSVGQTVGRGDPIALTGDMYETCNAAPHLHLEIRDGSLQRLFNPVDFIDADWDSLLLTGARPQSFARDLTAPRRWQALDDQPAIRLGGPLMNAYEHSWPASAER